MAFSSTKKPNLRKRIDRVVAVARRRSSIVAFGVISLLIGAAFFGLAGMQDVADSDEFSEAQLESDLQLLGAVGVRDSGAPSTASSTIESQDAPEPRRFEPQDGVGRPLIVGRFEPPETSVPSSGRTNFGRTSAADQSAPLFENPLAIPMESRDTATRSSVGVIQPTQFETTGGRAQANSPVATTPATAVSARPGQAAWLTGRISID
jgi:hypothetical protein